MAIPVEVEGLVDIYDQPFVIVDRNFRVVTVNQAFERAFDIPREDAAGRACYSLIQGRDRPCPCSVNGEHCPFTRVFEDAVTQSSVHSYRDGDGREHVVKIQGYPLRAESGEVFIGELIQRDAKREHPSTPEGEPPEPEMVGDAEVFRRVLRQLELAAGSEAPVLLQGATGTGKELAAAHVHRHSRRHKGPFITVDCTALTGDLFESELFGHERGAFTGSTGTKQGLFELADGGSLFLDEIGEMPVTLQAKLLRVLESGEFRRVGGLTPRRADVRVISATNRELRGVKWFRNDLYYRIGCVSVRLPTLAERQSDIPTLARELLVRIGHSSGRAYTVGKGALARLAGYDYPGNIRELRNILWIAAVNSPTGHITEQAVSLALPLDRIAVEAPLNCKVIPLQPSSAEPPVAAVPGHGAARSPVPPTHRPTTLAEVEAQHLRGLLERHAGNRRAVAKTLGVSERTVYRKLKRFGLS